MERNKFYSTLAVGYSCFLSPQSLINSRARFNRQMALYPISELWNIDEVAVLYRFLPRRAIHESNGTSSFIRVKEIMTVVLTIFADGSKALLTVIGKSMSTLTFPLLLDTMRDLGSFTMLIKMNEIHGVSWELLSPASTRWPKFKAVNSNSRWTTSLLTRLTTLN